MKKNLLLFVFLLFQNYSFSQIQFEQGYFINNENKKTKCWIKNKDWSNNPNNFTYKLKKNGKIKTANISDVSKFAIADLSKYERHKVKIDRSGTTTNDMSQTYEPEFEEKTVFLRLLVEGDKNLYEFITGNLYRYFVSSENMELTPLIYKEFLTPKGKVRQNASFRLHLMQVLKCQAFATNATNELGYNKKALVNFFIKYHDTCQNGNYIKYEGRRKRNLISFSIRPGITNSSITIDNLFSNSKDANFNNNFGFRIGIEAEFTLPFYNNKWAIILEPTFHQFKTDKFDLQNNIGNVKVNYLSMEFPIGIRHYFFLNENTKLFLNPAYTLDYNFNTTFVYENGFDIDSRSRGYISIGAGLKLKDKINVEARYGFLGDVLMNNFFWKSDYNVMSLIIGYRLF